MNKLLSGRYILTLIIGFVFATLAINETLPKDKVMEIILLVIYAYFTKERPTNGGVK